MLQQHKKYKGKDKDKEEVEEGEWDLDEDREEEWEEVDLRAEVAWADLKVDAAWEDMVVAELDLAEEVLAKEGALVGKEEAEGHMEDMELT